MFLKSESYKKGIFASTILNFLAKGLAFLNSILIAYLFGTNEHTDLYFYVLQFINLVSSFINGNDLLVLIPQAMNLREKKKDDSEMRYLNFFIRLYIIIGLIIAIVISVGPVFFYGLFSKFDNATLSGNGLLLIVSAIIIPLQLLTNLLVAIMSSYKYFSVPILASLINSVLCILFFLLLKDSLHISAGLVAILIGFIINVSFIAFLLKKKLNWKFSGKCLYPTKKNWHEIIVLELNLLPITIRSFLTFFFLSGLGAGILSSLNYATQVVFIPEMLILSQIMAVAGIKITELSAQDKKEDLNRIFLQIMVFLMFLFIPIVFYTILFSNEIAELIFLRGNINRDDVVQIGIAISFLIVLLPAKAFSDFFVTRFITAQQKLQTVISTIITMHVFICIIVCAGIYYFKLEGYFIALIISYWIISPVVFYGILRKLAPFLDTRLYYIKTFKILLLNAVIFSLLFFVKSSFIPHDVNNILVLSVGFIIYATLLIWINWKGVFDSFTSGILQSILKKIR